MRALNHKKDGTPEHPFPPQEVSTHPVQVVLSDNEIFKFRIVQVSLWCLLLAKLPQVYLLVVRDWRLQHGLDQSDIFQAGLNAKACLHGSREGKLNSHLLLTLFRSPLSQVLQPGRQQSYFHSNFH